MKKLYSGRQRREEDKTHQTKLNVYRQASATHPPTPTPTPTHIHTHAHQ